MDAPFKKTITIKSYDTDMNAQMSIQSLVKYFMEVAIDHSNEAGYPIDRLTRANRGWVVLNWVIKMYSHPEYNDILSIYTWAKPGNTLQATRYFTVENEEGKTIAAAASRWAFLDLEKRHPVRFTLDMEEAYCLDKPAPFDPGRFAMPKEKEEKFLSEKTITVRRSETDTNGHANNTRYVEWAVDDVPDDIYVNYIAEEINVLYRKECRAGDTVTVRTYIEDKDEGKKQIITTVIDKEGNVLCKMSTIWRAKNNGGM